ncbi:Bifunctional protein glmU [Thermodesulfobium narugense DSM 14796]|uniref:Bifunctional protein GlmU n=1 Tax=Thermodesulfobium narugense DSM 14796 TaxID=747365 RepID=M1E501_9BACT|nr:bifunctional UDP-N-acetylglucosamine diphosphorylase/glucosamine-1-phosphate N-acetyltransferase GlmU [Thermodesulfobium narugense]AEE13891.1 Bifunctional protein glmU [Thermodesulfobium narugense DSM 14796]
MIYPVILCAGVGKRMKSVFPKVMHCVLDKPMLWWVLRSFRGLIDNEPIVVVGKNKDLISQYFAGEKINYVVQSEPLGTAHALLCAYKSLKSFSEEDYFLVMPGDMPLIKQETIKNLCKMSEQNNDITFITCKVDDPKGYGRILRDKDNNFLRIVEEKDAKSDELNIKEVNVGIYLIKIALLKLLYNIENNNAQGEYYLTDLLELALKMGYKIGTMEIFDQKEVLGVNSQKDLLEAQNEAKRTIIDVHLDNGVQIFDINSTWIGPEVCISSGAKIMPASVIYGKSKIGSSTIGPFSNVENSTIGDNCNVIYSVIRNSTIGNSVNIGPFSHIREETVVHDNIRIGNFVELKKTEIRNNSKVSHLSYLGDTSVGSNVNVGAGTITCNYDGFDKHRTTIEDDVFVGSDSILVAPVKLSKGSMVAAGSVITRDVPEDSLGIGRASQVNKAGWVKIFRSTKAKKKDD